MKSSPWDQLRKDEELRGEILQDVVRCMPENLYFRQPDTQRTLTDILFIFCKLNPDVGYRQGMHELLAPILWVVEKDAVDVGQSSKAMGEDVVIKTVFDAEHIEHDTFAIFGQVMQSAKGFYEHTTTNGKENPMVARSRRIFGDMLSLVDEKLAQHLEQIDIVPQVFLIRWIRLLFGREFGFDEMLTLWDVIFAEDPSLEIVDHICLAMLLRIRWDLIDADYNVALTLLLKYPEPGGKVPAQTLALDGLYLRDHMDRHSGSYLVAKYTGKPLRQAGRPVTPPALQRNITTFSGQNTSRPGSNSGKLSPAFSPRATRNLEGVLQSTARNIYARGEKLGINKVVRNAVDEVQRKAQEIRDAQTPSAPPPTWHQRTSSGRFLADNTLLLRVQELEDRNRQLAKLLEGAVSELWDYQKAAAEATSNDDNGNGNDHLEGLSVAIAKVQFIQVYLGDPALPLPQEAQSVPPAVEQAENPMGPDPAALQYTPNAMLEERGSQRKLETSHEIAKPAEGVPAQSRAQVQDPEGSASSNEAVTVSAASATNSQPEIVVQSEKSPDSTSSSAVPSMPDSLASSSSPPGRPRLEQSSFSWMLGSEQASGRSTPKPISSLRSDHAQLRSALFGGPQDTSGSTGKDRQRRTSRETTSEPEEEQGFDLGTLRHSRGRMT